MKRWWVVGVLAVIAAFVLWWKQREPSPEVAKPVATTKKANTPIVRGDRNARPLATVAGTVRDEAGKPLAAMVCIADRCVTANTDGRYAIDKLAPDAIIVTASFPRFRPQSTDAVLDAGEQRVLDIVLKPGGVEVTGVVEDILGGPIAGAHVTLQGARAETDERGRFSLWVAPGREHELALAVATGYGPRVQPVRIPSQVTIALAPESSIAGRVVDEAGAPVAGARVAARGSAATATSGADGTFSIDQLGSGRFEIEATTVNAYGRHAGEVLVGVGERVEDIVVRVLPARTIVATVEIVGDRTICSPVPALSDWTFQVPKPWRDEAGRYHFEGVPPGTYAVELGCGAQVPPVVVGDDDVAVTWRVHSGGIVRGRVTSELADKYKYVAVDLEAVGSTKVPRREVADASGAFGFRGVPAGRYLLRAQNQRGIEVKSEPFEIANAQTVERDLVLRTPALGRVSGAVVDNKGRPLAQGYVRLFGIGMEYTTQVEVRDGRYTAEVPGGMYTASAFARDGNGRGDAIEVRAGETTTADLEIKEQVVRYEPPRERDDGKPGRYTLAGRVIDAKGAPVAGAIVTGVEQGLWDPDEETKMRATTQTDGTFTVVAKWSQVNVSAYRIGGGSTKGTLVAGTPATLRLAPRAAIAGVVTRADGSPAARFAVRVGEGAHARTHVFEHTGGKFSIDLDSYPARLEALINNVSGPSITVDGPRSDIALVLPATVTLRGRVVDGATRKPLAGVRVNGRQGLDGWAPWFIHADQITDDDGRFAMRELPPGPLMLELVPPSDQWSTQTMNVTVPSTAHDVGEINLSQVRRR